MSYLSEELFGRAYSIRVAMLKCIRLNVAVVFPTLGLFACDVGPRHLFATSQAAVAKKGTEQLP